MQGKPSGHAAFCRLAESLGCAVEASQNPAFDLVYEDDLAASVSLHSNGHDVAVDIWCCDAAALTGPPRRAVIKTLLLLNQASQWGSPLHIGLDSRDFVLLHGRRPLEGLNGASFAAWLTGRAEQGRRVRALVRTLSLEGCQMDFTLSRTS